MCGCVCVYVCVCACVCVCVCVCIQTLIQGAHSPATPSCSNKLQATKLQATKKVAGHKKSCRPQRPQSCRPQRKLQAPKRVAGHKESCRPQRELQATKKVAGHKGHEVAGHKECAHAELHGQIQNRQSWFTYKTFLECHTTQKHSRIGLRRLLNPSPPSLAPLWSQELQGCDYKIEKVRALAKSNSQFFLNHLNMSSISLAS